MSRYLVRHGDSLWKIAETKLGNATRWKEIAEVNRLDTPNELFIGQELLLPEQVRVSPFLAPQHKTFQQKEGHVGSKLAHSTAYRSIARAFFFVVADEVDFFAKKAVRKVFFPTELEGNPELVEKIMRPDKHGFHPRDPTSNVSIGRHVLGRTDSKFISASELTRGSYFREGAPYWIDLTKVLQEKGFLYDGKAIAKDLERIAAKTKSPEKLTYIQDILNKSIAEKEILIEGPISPNAIKSKTAMRMTRGLQFVTGVGIVISGYEMGTATVQTFETGSIKPLKEESIRQAGGWGGGLMGARLGAAAGTIMGIETGPGAIVCGAVGGLVGGVAGFFGAEWINEYIQ